MKKITIKKNGVAVCWAEEENYGSEQGLMDWFNEKRSQNHWGSEEEVEYIIEDVLHITYQDQRKKDYKKIDDLRIEAIAEFLFENRTEKAQLYKKLRAEIKNKYPKV